MKPFIIIQLRPEDETADSEFEAILRYGGLEPAQVQRVRIEQAPLPEFDLDNYSAIIVGGSPFDISTPAHEKSDVQKRVEADFRRLFDQIVPRDFPFLGACSGNGLLGSYCGAAMTRRYAEPVCGIDVCLTDAAQDEPLLAGFPERFRVLVGHKEACDDVPEGATLLVRGEVCAVQMFRVKRNLFATQFHPEGDPEGFITRIHAYKHHGYFPASAADALIDAVAREETPWGHELLRRFVDQYRK